MAVIITNEQNKIEIPAHWAAKINQVAEICFQEEEIPLKAEVPMFCLFRCMKRRKKLPMKKKFFLAIL